MHYRYQLISVKTVLGLINCDNEAYNFAPHPAPYAARSYQTIDDYMATDCIGEDYRKEVMKKLENEKWRSRWLLIHSNVFCECRDGSQRAVLNPVTWKFESACPCARMNQACSSKCSCNKKEVPFLASVVHPNVGGIPPLQIRHQTQIQPELLRDLFSRVNGDSADSRGCGEVRVKLECGSYVTVKQEYVSGVPSQSLQSSLQSALRPQSSLQLLSHTLPQRPSHTLPPPEAPQPSPHTSENPSPTAYSDGLCHNQISDYDHLLIDKSPLYPALTPRDLIIRDSWGIDAYTRHLIQTILHSIRYTDPLVDTFIQRCLFPALSALPSIRASDMRSGFRRLRDA